jgi:hypothetical protein
MNYNLQEIESLNLINSNINQIEGDIFEIGENSNLINNDQESQKHQDSEKIIKIKNQIKSNSPSEGIYNFSSQINFIKLFNENDDQDQANPYLDFVIYPSKSIKNNFENNGVFEIRANHLKEDEFLENLSGYCEKIGESVYLNSFCDYLIEGGVNVQILQ